MSVDQTTIGRTIPISDFGHHPVHRRILAVAVPAILANLTSVLPALVDTALVGSTGTRLDLGGIALGTTITGFILWAFSFLRIGTVGFTAQDRKSTRLNSSHGYISYAVFCLKKKTESYPTRHSV